MVFAQVDPEKPCKRMRPACDTREAIRKGVFSKGSIATRDAPRVQERRAAWYTILEENNKRMRPNSFNDYRSAAEVPWGAGL